MRQPKLRTQKHWLGNPCPTCGGTAVNDWGDTCDTCAGAGEIEDEEPFDGDRPVPMSAQFKERA